MITVRYSSVDGGRLVRKYQTLAGASNFARQYVGDHPDFGSTYAISSDGVGKVEVEGASLSDLFPQKGG